MKKFSFTVDDNIRFLKEICENGCDSIFSHPYLAMYKRLHNRFNLKVQLNLFYEMEDFNLSMMTDSFREEWKDNSDWLKMSFHSKLENEFPYAYSEYDEVFNDCKAVNEQVVRFAGKASLGETTTVHFCQTTKEGLQALKDNDVKGLLGLFGNEENPMTSYSVDNDTASIIRKGNIVKSDGVSFGSLDIVLNCFDKETILGKLQNLLDRKNIQVMIHEQYFYPDYHAYQPEFEEKLFTTFEFLKENGFINSFFEEMI